MRRGYLLTSKLVAVDSVFPSIPFFLTPSLHRSVTHPLGLPASLSSLAPSRARSRRSILGARESAFHKSSSFPIRGAVFVPLPARPSVRSVPVSDDIDTRQESLFAHLPFSPDRFRSVQVENPASGERLRRIALESGKAAPASASAASVEHM